MTPRRRAATMFAGAAVAGLVVWLVGAYVLAPGVIRRAYAGESLDLLNRVITGQDRHPPERYLNLWSRLAGLLSLLYVGAAVLGYALLLRREQVASWLARHLGGEPGIGFAALLRLGLWFGLLGGILEAAVFWPRSAQSGRPTGPPIESIWMGPTAAGVLGIAVAFALWLVARPSRRRTALRLPLFALTTLFVYSFLRAIEIGLFGWAATVLSVGVAVQAIRFLEPRAAGFDRLVRRTTPWLAGLVALTALGMGAVRALDERRTISALPEPAPGAPNVLLLILDTVRSESLSLYGYARDTSPALRGLGERGVVFDRAIATAPWTLPSHASMLTGLWPYEFEADFSRKLEAGPPTLAEVLGAHGYATAGFVANFQYTSRKTGLGRGFSAYRDYPLSPMVILKSHWVMSRAIDSARELLKIRGKPIKKTADAVNAELLAWLDRREERPYFAFLNYFDAHDPYETYAPFDRRFTDDPPQYWIIEDMWSRSYEPWELRELQDAYDASIAYLDNRIGQLIETLEARGEMDNTIVIVASDHGEQFGEHGLVLHANSLYRPSLRVPLVVVHPDSRYAGRRIEEVASIRDIPATILDLAGLPADLPGESLRRHWTGAESRTERAIATLTQNVNVGRNDPTQRGDMVSFFEGPLHYVRNGDGEEELYNVLDDPAELSNLALRAEHAPALEHFRDLVAALPSRAQR